MGFSVVELILKKRNGEELSEEEILWFVGKYAVGDIPDYQAAAFLMAVCLKDMTARETAALTQAMVQSGTTLDLSELPGPKVDKHSTGGVGDKTSLILAPIVASFGALAGVVALPKRPPAGGSTRSIFHRGCASSSSTGRSVRRKTLPSFA